MCDKRYADGVPLFLKRLGHLLRIYKRRDVDILAREQEQKWIRAIVRRGDRTAADALVRAHYDALYAYIWRQVGQAEDALDLTQESFIAALQSLGSYDKRKSAFRTWLYHIAAHKIIDHRRKRRVITEPLTEDISAPEDFTALVHDRALSAQAEELVRREDPLEQEIFRLHVYGECTFPQIAAVTGQAEAKIKSRYYRLIARLRKEMTDDA